MVELILQRQKTEKQDCLNLLFRKIIQIYEQSASTNEDIFKHMLSDKADWFESVAGNYELR